MDDASTPPELDPELDAEIRDLLASAPPPTMPSSVEQRVLLALAAERNRRGVGGGPAASGRGPSPRHEPSGPVTSRPSWTRMPLVAASVATAAVALAALAALYLGNRPSAPAAAVVASSPTSSPLSSVLGARLHLQASPAAYDTSTLTTQARALLTSPAPPLRPDAPQTATLGPLATTTGLAACLEALGVQRADQVSADLASFAGQPAAIIVVTSHGASTAWAVGRGCSASEPEVLHDATPVP